MTWIQVNDNRWELWTDICLAVVTYDGNLWTAQGAGVGKCYSIDLSKAQRKIESRLEHTNGT